VEQGANAQRTGGLIDKIIRQVPSGHQREHLPSGSHPVRAGDRHVACISAISDGDEFNPWIPVSQGERLSRWRGLIDFDMGVRSFEHDNVTQPARLKLIGGDIENAAIDELVPAVLLAHASFEQAQASPHSLPTEQRLKGRRHFGAASITGASILETNPLAQRQDGVPQVEVN